MKKLLIILFLVLVSICNAATRYCVLLGNGKWSSTTNWSTTSGGTGGASAPTSSDDVIFDALSPSTFTVDVTSNCLSFTSTSYIGTLNIAPVISLTVFGNIILGSAMSFSGTGFFSVNANSTILTNSVNIPNFTFGTAAAYTVTLSDNINCTNNSFLGSPTVNSHTIFISGNLIGGLAVPVGTTTITMNGTGTVSGLRLANPFVINTSGTCTLSGTNQWNNNGSSFTYMSGTVVTTSGTCIFRNTTISSGISCQFSNVVFDGTNETLTTDMYVNGDLTSGSTGWTTNGSFNIYVSGSVNTNSGAGSGVPSIIMTGTGTLTGRLDNNLSINTSGTITFGSNISRAGPSTFAYVSGSVSVGSNTFTAVSGTVTLNLPGITLNNVTCPNNIVLTLNSNLSISGTLSTSQSITFNGTGNCTINTWAGINSGRVYQLQTGNTYAVTNSISLTGGTSGSHCIMQSSSGSVKAVFNLSIGCSQNLKYLDGTRIDSSGGIRVRTYKGVLTTDINWSNRITDFNTFN